MSADNVTFHKAAFRTVSICICGSDSVVECYLAKVKVEGSNPFGSIHKRGCRKIDE